MTAQRVALASVILVLLSCGARGESGNDLGEVLVTVRKRLEAIDTLPLAVDVLDSEELARGSVTGLQSLAAREPGLYFESMWGGANSAPVLRGQAQPSTAGDNVGVFVDGVYQGDRNAVDVDMLDMARIEVVRGPQSALYGRSTFAGAINYVSNAPSDRPAASATVEAGSGRYTMVQGWMSGPLSGRWHARLAGGLHELGETASNAAPGGSGLGGGRRASVYLNIGTADAAAGDGSTSLLVRYQHDRSEPPPEAPFTYSDYNCGSRNRVSGAWSYYCGALPSSATYSVSTDLPPSRGELLQGVLRLVWTHGSWRVNSESSYYRSVSDMMRDFDASASGELYGVCVVSLTCPPVPGGAAPVVRLVGVNQVSRQVHRSSEAVQELRVSGVAGRLAWMAGAMTAYTEAQDTGYFAAARGDLAPDERLTALLPATPLLVGPLSRLNGLLVADPSQAQLVQDASSTREVTSAAFTALDYALGRHLSVHGELRLSRERQSLDAALANFAPGFGRAIQPVGFSDVTPRASVSWQASDRSRWYVSAAKGSRSGGTNPVPRLLPQEQGFRPESNWTTEIGWRGADSRHALSAQVTVFYIDWENTQITGFSNTPGVDSTIIRNTAGITTRGFEAGASWQPQRQVGLQLAYSWVDPRFRAGSDDPGGRTFCGLSAGNTTSTFCAIGPYRAGSPAAPALVPWVDGNVLGRTSRNTWHGSADWASIHDANGRYRWLRIDVGHQDDVFERSIDGARYGARTLVDARLGITSRAWSVELWGRNLADTHYVRAVSSRGATFYPATPRPLDLLYGDERQLGLTVRVQR